MGFNVSGTLAVFQAALKPEVLLPRLIINDIRQLDLARLRSKGVVGVVIDKDNCLTKPEHDRIVAELHEAWPRLVRHFGRRNVLIVSNTAGTRDDAGLLQAESVSRNLGVPVLLHSTKKPGCSKAVLQYFNSRREGMVIDTKGKGRLLGDSLALSLPAASCTMRAADEQSQQAASKSTRKRILVIGDRVMTDVILGNRMNARSGRVPVDGHSDATFEAVPILCTRLWQAEGFLTRVMRNLENLAMRRMFARFTRLNKGVELDDWKLCVVREEEATPIEPAVQKAGTVQDRLRKSFWNLAASLGRTLYRPFQPVIQSMQEVSREAGQLHYGFRRPESLRNLKDLRNRIETFQASPKVRPGADG